MPTEPDLLTQLQDAVDQMATQCFSAIRYINKHHDYVPLTATEARVQPDPTQTTIDAPEVFAAARQELARDLVLKTKQVEVLITSLPGIGVSEEEQEERLRRLEEEVRAAEEERSRALVEAKEAERRLEEVLRGLRRV